MSLFLNPGSPALSPAKFFDGYINLNYTLALAGMDTYDATVADLDGDGVADDIVVAFRGPNLTAPSLQSVVIFRNNGAGNSLANRFAPGVEITIPQGNPIQSDFTAISSGQLELTINGTTQTSSMHHLVLSIVPPTSTTAALVLLQNNGTNIFVPAVLKTTPANQLNAVWNVQIQDIDNDNKNEIIAYGDNGVAVFFGPFTVDNNNGLTPTSSQFLLQPLGSANLKTLAIGNLSGGPNPDIAWVQMNAQNNWQIAVAKWNGNQLVAPFPPIPLSPVDNGINHNVPPGAIAIGDLGGGGPGDIVVAYPTINRLYLILNPNGGGVAQSITPAAPPPGLSGYPGDGPDGLVIADVDGDGQNEIILHTVGGGQNPCIAVLNGHDPTTIEALAAVAYPGFTLGNGSRVIAKDLDGDGAPEVVVLCYSGQAAAANTSNCFLSILHNSVEQVLTSVVVSPSSVSLVAGGNQVFTAVALDPFPRPSRSAT